MCRQPTLFHATAHGVCLLLYAWTGNISDQPVHGLHARAFAHGHAIGDSAHFRRAASAAARAGVVGGGYVAGCNPRLFAEFDAAC